MPRERPKKNAGSEKAAKQTLGAFLLSAALAGSALAAEPVSVASTATLRKQCIGYGYKAGTDALAECVMKLDLLITEEQGSSSQTPAAAPKKIETPTAAPPPKNTSKPTTARPVDDTPLRPIMSTHTSAPYPEVSLKLGEQGTTLTEIHITHEGTVDDCKVITSSSSARLDQAACEHVKLNWRWEPPTKNGQPIAVSTRVSHKWEVKEAAITPLRPIMNTHTLPPWPVDAWKRGEQGTVLMEVTVTTEGKVSDCKIIKSSSSHDLDQVACAHVQNAWRWEPSTRNGEPIAVRTRVSVMWTLKDAPFNYWGLLGPVISVLGLVVRH